MHFVRRLYLPFLILLCALWAFTPLEGGDDFWAHAAIGRIVLDTGHVPKSTVYLWSDNVPWVFHAYGSGVIYAFLLRLGGPWLCLCLNFALAITPLVLVWRHAKARAGEVPLVLVCLFVPALWFSSVRWRLRPEGFTVLFLTITLLFLAQEKRPRWQYFALAALFALWPNLHGGVLVGILVLWSGAIADIAQNRLVSRALPSTETSSPDAPLPPAIEAPLAPPLPWRINWSLFALAVACSLLPMLCNPWGFGYRTVFGGTAATAQHISEWRHFWAFPAMNRGVAYGLTALCVLAIIVWCLDRQKRATVGAALLLLTALWIQARRQMWLTSTTCMVALAQSAALFNSQRIYAALKGQRDARPDAPMRLIAHLGTLLILLCACVVNLPAKRPRALSETFPVAMSQFLLSKATPPGRTFNDYEYSAALEWYLDGKRPLYIDLINAYHPSVFDNWYNVAHADDKGLKFLDQWKVDVIALRPVNSKNTDDPITNLGKYLETAPTWKQIYKGADGRVWRRRKLYNAPVIFNAGRGLHQLPGSGAAPR